MKPSINDVWDLIGQLTPQERKIIYKRLHEDINFKLNDILEKVNERVKEDEIDLKLITDEVELIRGQNYEKN